LEKVIGIDGGGVIIERERDENNPLAPFSAVPEAFNSIKRLREVFGEKLFIVSAVGRQSVANAILIWLGSKNFFEETGVLPRQIFFVLKREHKASICKKLEITHFIDDRMEILSSLVGVVGNLYLFNPDPAEIKPYADYLRHVHQVSTWPEALEMLIK
jgi:hypothetical protein